MTPMTAIKPRRTYITEVHNSLADKIGKEGADTLTHYLEEVIPAQIEDKVQFLATKEDVAKVEAQVANVRADLKEDIANVRADLKEDIANVRAEVAKVEIKVVQAEARMTHEVSVVKQEVAKVRGELKEGIANVKADLTKWMLATIITIALGVLALYFKK